MKYNSFPGAKPHYLTLDGLRGVAALTVVLFHILEIFSGGSHLEMLINHGYLAVDFFFLLSGFVIAHAYDDRWHRMNVKEFFKRRLIRLHPMIVMGMLTGALLFYWSGAPGLFPHVDETPLWKLVLVTILGLALIPVPLSLDIRGWQEMYPLNGPAWSLFFEYIANILYALILRRVTNTALTILVVLAAAALIHLGVTSPYGDIIGGWSLDGPQLHIGFTRLLFPFLAGMLLHRVFKPVRIKNAFLLCSLMLLAILAFPRVGGEENLWANGLYDSLTIIILFPLIVFLGASGSVTGKRANQICKFLGDISYPIYIVHYPIAYVFYAWVVNNNVSLSEAWPMGVVVFVLSVTVAYVTMRFYDIPVRRWFMGKFMGRK